MYVIKGVEVGVEESIVNEPLVLKTLIQMKNNAKSEVRLKQLIRIVIVRSQSTLQRQRRQLRHQISKKHPLKYKKKEIRTVMENKSSESVWCGFNQALRIIKTE
jgi:hypothetical protein